MTKIKSNNITFEESVKQLNIILDEIENKELTIDELVDKFEKGSKLSRECIEKLKLAELKIQKIINSNDIIKK